MDLTNHKSEARKGKVQLINASEFYTQMRKSLGSKRREITAKHIQQITDIFQEFNESEISKVFDSTDFGFRKVTIECPLKLNFQASTERIERLKEQTAFINLANSKKKSQEAKQAEELAGKQLQNQIMSALITLPDTLYKDRNEFEKDLKKALKKSGLTISATIHKAIISALSEVDETANICVDKKGNPEADTNLRDTENIPLKEDINEYFVREVKPHVIDAWINETVTDDKDGEIGKVGYEINFNRYFYQYIPPRPLAEIETDLKVVEGEILELLKDIA